MMTVSIQYPATSGSRFDLDYYMNTHMPMVRDRFAAFGLAGDQVMKGDGAPGGKEAFQVTTLLMFPAKQNFIDAVAAHGDEVMGDIPKFTDTTPAMQFNQTVPG